MMDKRILPSSSSGGTTRWHVQPGARTRPEFSGHWSISALDLVFLLSVRTPPPGPFLLTESTRIKSQPTSQNLGIRAHFLSSSVGDGGGDDDTEFFEYRLCAVSRPLRYTSFADSAKTCLSSNAPITFHQLRHSITFEARLQVMRKRADWRRTIQP